MVLNHPYNLLNAFRFLGSASSTNKKVFFMYFKEILASESVLFVVLGSNLGPRQVLCHWATPWPNLWFFKSGKKAEEILSWDYFKESLGGGCSPVVEHLPGTQSPAMQNIFKNVVEFAFFSWKWCFRECMFPYASVVSGSSSRHR